MITIIHGDDVAASRKYFSELKTTYADGKSFVGDTVTLNDLVQVCEGGGLFEDSKTIFIEQLLSKKKKGRTADPLVAYLAQQGETNTIILWEGKEVTKATLAPFKQATVKLYKLPQTLFLFLDSIKPNNGKMLISLFHKTIENTEPEMVFFMLIRQFRLLLALSKDQSLRGEERRSNLSEEIAALPTVARNDEIDEAKRLAPWQKGKLQKQAELFETEQLINIYHKLFVIEHAQKTGKLAAPIVQVIDFLLLEI